MSRKAFHLGDVVDLTMPIRSLETPVFPGYPMPLKATYTTVRENGYFSNVWTFAEHTASHVDAPAHFIEGADTVEKVPAGNFVGEGVVLDFSQVKPRYEISADDLEKKLREAGLSKEVGKGWVILFYTGYSSKAGTKEWMEHPVLSEDACEDIVRMKVNAVGFDSPSPDREPFPAHKKLLPKGIVIYENLTNLDALLDKKFLFVGLPLSLAGGSASPVRAIAIIR